MSGFSDERMKKILAAAFGGAAYEEAAENWLTLTTAAVKPGDTGASIAEIGYTGFARIPTKDTEWTAPAGTGTMSTHNNVTKLFAECTGAPDIMRGWAVLTTEELASGLVIFSGSIPETKVNVGVEPEFLAGQLVASMIAT